MVLFLAAAMLAGQQQLPEPITVTTQMVQVSVVVRDKSGPVAGLQADDFILRDRGRPQKIAIFQTSSSRTARGMSAPLAPGEFTNRPYADGQVSPHAIVIVWDHLNTRAADGVQAKRQVLKALSEIQSNDRIGLYALDSQLRIIQDFTSDSSLLVAALNKYREQVLIRSIDSPSVPPTDNPVALAMYGAMMGEIAGASMAHRAGITAAAVRAIANHLAGVPGRTSVIWVASEFPGAAMSLAYAGIGVYPVDARGPLLATPQSTVVERMIARQSGGIAYVDNDIRGAIDQAVKDSEVSYTLGFYPDRPPDRMNSLKIEVKRRGLEAGYRGAYSGIAGPPSSRASQIDNAFASPLDATQISLDVRLQKEGAGWALSLELDPSQIAFETKNGHPAGGVEIALRQLSAQGAVLTGTKTTADLEYDAAHYREFMSKNHVVKLLIPNPKPGLGAIRLGVADRVSGRVGSLMIPVR